MAWSWRTGTVAVSLCSFDLLTIAGTTIPTWQHRFPSAQWSLACPGLVSTGCCTTSTVGDHVDHYVACLFLPFDGEVAAELPLSGLTAITNNIIHHSSLEISLPRTQHHNIMMFARFGGWFIIFFCSSIVLRYQGVTACDDNIWMIRFDSFDSSFFIHSLLTHKGAIIICDTQF